MALGKTRVAPSDATATLSNSEFINELLACISQCAVKKRVS